jgi:hypothetical protein
MKGVYLVLNGSGQYIALALERLSGTAKHRMGQKTDRVVPLALWLLLGDHKRGEMKRGAYICMECDMTG